MCLYELLNFLIIEFPLKMLLNYNFFLKAEVTV